MEVNAPPRRSRRAQTTVYLIALAVYLCAIYLPFLWMPPLPQDAAYAKWGLDLPWHTWIYEAQPHLFGASPVVFRLQNYLLLFGCSVVLFFLTARLVGPPLWLASFSAVLFMANPAKGPIIYSSAGFAYFSALLFSFLALHSYARWREQGRYPLWLGSLGLACLAMVLQPVHAWLVVPLFFLHQFYGDQRDWKHFAAALLVLWGGWGLLFGQMFPPEGFTRHPMVCMLPLYPIGFLPDTVEFFNRFVWLEWGCLLFWTLLGVQLWKKVRHPALALGWGSGLLIMLLSASPDLVTLARGEVLLLPMALVHIGLAAVVQCVWQHPKWRKSAVLLTAFWCVVFFVLQVRAGLMWWPAES